MANTNAPRGLIPVKTLSGASWNEQTSRYYIPSSDTNVYKIGSPVISSATADAYGVPSVTIGLGTSTYRGVIVGVEPVNGRSQSIVGVPLSLETIYIPATKTRDYYVYVVDDPNALFEVQDDGLAALTATAANKNASLTINDTGTSPYSSTVLSTASVATTSTLNIRIMGLVQRENNAFGVNAKWLVKINQHELMGNTAGI